ncbi:lipopolysaccharide biosynthesis protein [Chelativorans sp. M5D2P16]|uniref:lipopolysaccharide biosynthesis protein n=1 Tax=Chelativorans sp. M5D2P16 TaxID=3095678 RepID=UPI002AC9FC3B|nr:lipopolysaccharide biosynthesis protein [Chelativorans sp. M5D2P16]MDZ5698897.1 lipopolysaccharide biosynthesis protein [Chelativorans sp. M5D2P16]
MRDYFAAISGSAGRLVFSLGYFIVLANTLSIADFGLFATASAAGVMLSRILAFGFTAPLYRIATVKPRLIGTYTAGFLLMSVLSLPVLGLASVGVYLLFFGGDMPPGAFALVVVAEALLWRPAETVVIVNNGLNRFGRGALLVVLGTAVRALAAVLLALVSNGELWLWTQLYLLANAVSLLVAAFFFYPWQRMRLRPALYLRRLADAVYVSSAEVLFYFQMELDKLLVLALGGAQLAGIYAIIMRLVDLTAIPIRTFSMLLVQKMMRTPDMLARIGVRLGIEGVIFAVSTTAILALALILRVFPNILGRNVAEAAPLVLLALFVPGMRNLVEYQAELLFARGQTLLRAINLMLLAGTKAVLLAHVLAAYAAPRDIVLALNGVFAALYLVSLLLTYCALSMPAKRV